MKEKHDQIMAWIDLPLDKRPQLIMGASIVYAGTGSAECSH
jgi:hypothetical protein